MKSIDKIHNTDVRIEAPPAKAHTLRALAISSLADGQSVIHNPLLGQDQLNLIESLKNLGVRIEHGENKIIVHGSGGKFSPVSDKLNVGESGIAMNFLSSIACLADKPVIITGAKRITERPIAEVVTGLKQLGCNIEYLADDGFPPIRVSPSFNGGFAKMNGQKTSQYFSSIAIAAPYADNPVTLKCIDTMTERPYFDISLEMMTNFGVEAINDDYKNIQIPNNKKYSASEITIEGDYSSASFFFLAAAICNSKVTVTHLNPETKQGDKKFLDLIENMGCEILIEDNEVSVKGNALNSIEVDMSDTPDLVPPLAIAAAFATGTTRLTNIGHLRHKECDRLAVMASELNKMGASAMCDDDSLIIKGGKQLYGAVIDPHNDHRIAMSFAIAGLVTGSQTIENEMCTAKSFPDFWEKFKVFS